MITVQRYQDEDEAVDWANDNGYAVGASGWTSDHGQALRVTQRPDAGDIWINCHSVLAPEVRHGGARHSGFKHVVSRFEP